MKKLLLTLAMGLLAWSASAQNWTVGGRIGSGFQAVGQYVFSNDNYVEARFGAYWANAGGTVTADFSVLYNWNVCNMDWTPSAGRWFFDAGAGINVGGKGHYAYVGVAGSAKLGIAFKAHQFPLIPTRSHLPKYPILSGVAQTPLSFMPRLCKSSSQYTTAWRTKLRVRLYILMKIS